MSESGLCLLPSHIIQCICQLLIDSGSLRNVLSLRATCSAMFSTINNLCLLLKLRVKFSTFDCEKLDNFLGYLAATVKWRLENLVVIDAWPDSHISVSI